MESHDISSWARQHEPVFIVGAPRSGSTVLYRRLQQHSSFTLEKEENLAETDAVAQLSALAYFRPGRPKRMWQFMLQDEERYEDFIASVSHLTRYTEVIRKTENWFEERGREVEWPWWATPYHLILRSYFYHAWRARGANRLLEKTPHHVGHTGLFKRAFPRAFFLHIHRHPIDVYSSYLRRVEVEPSAASWADLSPAEFCELYREFQDAALRWAQRLPDRFRLVSYERLTRETEREFKDILDFVGEPYERDVAIEEDPDLSKWERSPHLYGQLTPKTKRWQDYMPVEKAARVEDELAPLMRRFGYERYT